MDTAAFARALAAVTNPFALAGYVVLVLSAAYVYHSISTLSTPSTSSLSLQRSSAAHST
jgi:hypothetical protein